MKFELPFPVTGSGRSQKRQNYIRHIWTHDLELMEKEITEADDKDCIGMDCDRADWLKLREVIRKELKRRANGE